MSDVEDIKRTRFAHWAAIFKAALQGAAGSDKPIVRIVEDAGKIADEAVAKIAEREPK